ncbi:MAG: hypothetical protein ABFD54_06665 [Armatimonadota bacterium]|nr:hypothetical protein [bacterium]
MKFECGIDSNQITKITIPANNNSSGHLEWTYDYYTSLGWEYKVKQVTGPAAGDDLPTIVSFTHDTKIVGNKNYKATMVRDAAWDIAAIDILYSQVSTMQRGEKEAST